MFISNSILNLAYLIEDNEELQEIASISNHLIKNVSNYFIKHSTMDKETVENLREVCMGFCNLKSVTFIFEFINSDLTEMKLRI